MNPKMPDNLFKIDFLSIWVDRLAISTAIENHQILMALQKAQQIRKLAQGLPEGAIPCRGFLLGVLVSVRQGRQGGHARDKARRQEAFGKREKRPEEK